MTRVITVKIECRAENIAARVAYPLRFLQRVGGIAALKVKI